MVDIYNTILYRSYAVSQAIITSAVYEKYYLSKRWVVLSKAINHQT
jgi:hypothetical protein